MIIDKSWEWDETERYWDEMWKMRTKRPNRRNLQTWTYTKDQLPLDIFLKLPLKSINLICLVLDEVRVENPSNEDSGAYLPKLQHVVETIGEAVKQTNDPKTIEACRLVQDKLGGIINTYGGADRLFKKDLGIYIDKLLTAFWNRDGREIRDGTEVFEYMTFK